jgi:hypothetical protein
MNYFNTIWIPLVPLLVFIFTGLFRPYEAADFGLIGTTGLLLAFIVTLRMITL